MCSFFFFQAEDGIRDLTVTGVQTCALPISRDRLGDYSTDRRTLLLTSMAAAVGVMSAFVAVALVRLIGFFTNPAFFPPVSPTLTPPAPGAAGAPRCPTPPCTARIIRLCALDR